MRLSIFHFAVGILASISFFCFSKEKEPNYHHFEIGPTYCHVDLWIEPTPITDGLRCKGNTWGAMVNYSYRVPNGIFINFNGMRYEGDIFASTMRRYFINEMAQGYIGYNFMYKCCGHMTQFTPYTGFGFGRISQSNIGPTHIHVDEPTYCIPFGFLYTYMVNKCFTVNLNFNIDPQVDVTFETSALDHARWNLKNKYGVLIALPLLYHHPCLCNATFDLMPFWMYLRKGSGTAVSRDGVDIPIPGQRFHFIGVNFAFGVTF